MRLLLLLPLVLLGLLGLAAAGAPAPPGPAATPAPPLAPSLRAPLRLNACAGDGGEVSYWTRALRADDLETRLQAAGALGETRSEAAVPALLRILGEASVELRLVAIQALARIGPGARAAIPALTEALGDRHPAVRSEARRALQQIDR